MRSFLLFLLLSVVVQLSVAPPVNQKNKNGEHDNENEVEEVEATADMEYHRYLMEVVQVLESDPEFREKLVKADEADIHTGKIADELQFVNHNVRSRLDEIKREELERLRHLATKENELRNGLNVDHYNVPEHLDHTNQHSFEIQDLKKLIAKTSKDLAKADRKRQEKFKQYEMEKHYEEQEKLKHMNDMDRKKYEQELEAMKQKRKEHEHVNHPGSRRQLEDVWEAQDDMGTVEFNPKIFFFLHDVDGNGVWDQDEVKALFLKELDKLYAKKTSPDDLLKRAEEMERMREHVFNEADLNKDGLISYEEFLEQTKKPDFQEDDDWQGLDEQQIYTPEEFEAFERHKQEEIQKMIAKGMPPPHPDNIPAQPQLFPPQYGHAPVVPGVVPQVDPNQNVVHQQQFQGQANSQYHQYQVGQERIPVHQLQPGPVSIQQPQGQVPIQQQGQMSVIQQGQVPIHQQGQVPIHQQGQVPIHQQGQVPVQQQGQIPIQQQGQIPVQQQGQIPIQQQGQIPVQSGQPQLSNFQQQNAVNNQVPQNIENNAIPQQNKLN